MYDTNVIHSHDGRFSVLLHNRTGAWKIVAGQHDLEALGRLTVGMDRSVSPRDYRVITVFLNNTCNLRCDYCRFEPLTHHALESGKRDLAAVVESIGMLVQPGETVDIHFQGGEPLLRVADIAFVCEALSGDSVPFRSRFHVTTNGTIAHERALQVLERYAIEVTLSVDGMASEHDAHRVYPDGSGSYDKVIQTLATLRARAIPVGVFCVVSNPHEMAALHDHLTDTLGLRTFIMAPLEIDGTGSAEKLETYLSAFFEWQVRLLERNIERYVREGVRIREQLGWQALRGKADPAFFSKACGNTPHSACGQRMHSIERNGDVMQCQNIRLNANQGVEYVDSCIKRKGICESCEIRAHCSTPICFSRLAPAIVKAFDDRGSDARAYVDAACRQLKRRELALFDLFYRRKDDVIRYLV